MDARTAAAARRGARPVPSVLVVVLAFLLAACSAAGGAPAPSATPAATPSAAASAPASPSPQPTASAAVATFPATLTDDEGTAVSIPAEPAKIVSLTPAATETLFALGVGDRLVGKVEDFTPYPPDAADVPDVAKYGSVDVEKIVGLGTDLVIAGGNNFNPPEAITKLRSLGVPVLVVYPPDVATALTDIELIGQAVGKPEEASGIAGDIRSTFDAVRAATASLPKPRVYYEIDATNGFFGPAPDYFGTEMMRIAGGEPLTSGTNGVFQIEPEKILAFDPEVILLGDASYGVTPDQVAARPGWKTLTAVANGDVRPIDDVVVTRPGPRLVDGIRTLATAIHPGIALPSALPSAAP